ncbi:MAG: hypothetical protein J6V42_06090 [Clostridia bacterium]|nr:hypothetical protein [Clostridia bacterium]
MNTIIVFALCSACLIVGIELGSWKEGKAVSKAIDDLSAMHYKEIRLIVDKILESKKENKEGE